MAQRRTREEKYPDTATFHFHNENPKNRITGDCTFRAIATASGKAWETVVMEMAEMSCRTGYAINDKKGIEKYLNEQGWVKMKQPRKGDNTKYTGEEFCAVQKRYLGYVADDVMTYGACYDDGIVISSNIIADVGGHHIVAIIDGTVWDTWNSTHGCVGNYWIKP